MARLPTSLPRPRGAARTPGRGRWRKRLAFWPLLWSLLATGLALLGIASSWPELWQGMLLTIPLLIATTGWGWRGGVLLLPPSLLVLWLSQAVTGPQGLSYYLGFLAACGLGIFGGQSLYQLWRASERRARHRANQARLLAKAVIELEVGSASELYAALPRLLDDILAFSHAEVFIPGAPGTLKLAARHRWDISEDFTIPLSCVCGQAYQQKSWQYVPDSRLSANFMQAPGAPAIRSELAIPLLLEGEAVAVLNLEHTRPHAFDSWDREVLRAFAKIAEATLLRLNTRDRLERQAAERGFAAHLHRQLLLVASAEEAAQRTLEVLLRALGLETATVLILERGRFRPLALLGPRSEAVSHLLAKGLPWKRGQLYQSWRSKRAIFVDDYQNSPLADDLYRELGTRAIALVPVMNAHAEVQALLELPCYDASRPWSAADQELLSNVADALGLALERTGHATQLREMLEVIRALAQADDPRSLYQATVEAAVRLIPGCEAASLLVRTPEGFTFRGAVGFDKGGLEATPTLSDASQLHWYGGDEESYRRGVPRVLSGVQVWARSRASREGTGALGFDRAGKTLDIRCNLCVPIIHQQEILGTLNLDSFSREDAFGQGELVLAEAFGQQLAVTIRQAQYREALERSVVTDALTGLGNRAGFNRHLILELATARRYGQPFSLLLIDLNNFKQVNDSLGHQAGDEALIKVARALRRVRRESDSLYRWGGDEFALLLPKSDGQNARAAARRYTEAIASVSMGHVRLGASVGIASYPEDGDSSGALLAHADALLYEHKAVA